MKEWKGRSTSSNRPMRLRRAACTWARRRECALARSPVQGYPRSLCPKTLAINLRARVSGASERAKRPGRAAPMAVAARRQDSFTSCITLMG